MKQGVITAIFCSMALLCFGAGTKSQGFMVTFHLEGSEEETDKFVTPVILGSERRQYFFKKMPAFTDKDLLWYYPFEGADGSYGAAFRLNETKSQELTGLTIENQGRLLGSRVLDAPLQALVIDRPVNDGVIVIWSGLTQTHLKTIGQKIPHIEKVQKDISTPSFQLPEGSPGQTESEPGKPKLKLFNPFKKSTPPPTSPYESPTE